MVEVRRCSRPPHRICQCWSTPAGERPVPSSAATLAQSLTPLFTSARSFVSSSSDHRGTFAPGARLRVWKRRCEMQSQNSADAAQCGVCPNLVEGGAERGRNLSQSGPVAGPVRRCERVQQGWHTVFSLAACHTLAPSPHPRSLPSPPQPRRRPPPPASSRHHSLPLRCYPVLLVATKTAAAPRTAAAYWSRRSLPNGRAQRHAPRRRWSAPSFPQPSPHRKRYLRYVLRRELVPCACMCQAAPAGPPKLPSRGV